VILKTKLTNLKLFIMGNRFNFLVIPLKRHGTIKANLIRIFILTVALIALDFANVVNAAEFQQVSIGGIITDQKGAPLTGVTVAVKGSTIGTLTDVNGKYSISNVPQNATLVFSFVGMKAQEILIEGRTQINVILNEEAIGLEEVVVVGYGTQKKVNLTGSVASISVEELVDKPVATTSQALAGLVPGLSVVQTSGRPGTSATVRIRGTGTFSSAGTAPLVLIDGMSGEIDDVDPENIQSISFLKDAASASIYGNRAANGVILIQTKKGIVGKVQVTYNSSFGWQKPTELPDFLPSWEFATYYNEAMANMGRAAAYTDTQIQTYKDGSDPDNYPNVNHLKWLLNTGSGFQQRHSVGLQGGTEALTYNLSVGYFNQNGMTANTSTDRYNILWNMKSNITNTLTLTTNLNAFTTIYNAPSGVPASIDGIIGYSVREGPIYAGTKTNGTFGYQDNYSPEAWMQSGCFVLNNGVDITGTIKLAWETPIKGLILNGTAGLNYGNDFNKSYIANTYFDDSKTVGPASVSVSESNSTYKTFEGTATYTKQFGAHSLSILAGTSRETSVSKDLSGGRNTFPNNFLFELSSGDASTASNSGGLSEWALVSLFGRVNYSFNDRYLLEGNLRYDGSSRFADNNRWGLFPSFSAGWRISEESFWKNANLTHIVNSFKIRGSWGVLGNQNIGTYPYQQTYALGQSYAIGNPAVYLAGARLTTLNNSDITWESTSVTDIGLDFGLFGGKISGVVDYFYKYTFNILSAVQVDRIMGRSVGQSNVGAVSNEGIELNLTYNGKIGNDFRFSIAPNFSYIKNAVEKLANGATQEINNGRIVGQPLGIIYGYTTNGLFVDQTEIDGAPTQIVSKTSLKPGYISYVDISGVNGVPDGLVNATYDRSVIGSTTPTMYFGLNLSASIKGFDFSALFQGMGGYQRLIGSYMAYAFYNGGQIQRWQVDNRWTVDNPDKYADYPRLETLNMNNANLQTSTYWLRDASFLRLKNLQVGYTIPKRIISRIGIENFRVYVSGQNLLSINSFYKGWDPENQIGTGDAPSFYPINSIYSFGFNVKF
jgi:TonB-dependent starch-binding outer membrane protein SusC